MARVVVSLRIMPNSPSVDLSRLESQAKKEIVRFCSSEEFKASIEPIAFGLKALNLLFVMEESIGTTEKLEKAIAELEGVESVEVTDVRRAVG
ncbi:elongation factor 1-beta [Candidatus Woesearchaeota archaeon]|nr:elongation factor 1-beta [Candidatus Woesearchaeota archaeon]